jgi:hypothetical protein
MYTLDKATPKLVTATRNAWIEQTGALGDLGVLVADDVKVIFDDIEREDCENEYTYILRHRESPHGRAFLKIMHAVPQLKEDSWLKLLKIQLEPNLNGEGDKTSQFAQDMFIVLSTAIFESIKLIFTAGINTLKIYGRTEEMRSMFVALLSNEPLNTLFIEKGLEARREGGWLVINRTSE